MAMILSFAAGTIIMLQAPINAKLGFIAGSPLWAAFFSFLTGTVFLGLMMLLTRLPLNGAALAGTSPWMWTGGLLGSFFVATTIFAVPLLGPGLMIVLIIAGQMLGALLLDHTGFLLSEAHPMNMGRLAGAICILAGVILIKKF
jgi:transporter family-2 protein